MHRWKPVLAALMMTATGLVAAAPHAEADVRGDLVLVGERPVVGTYDLAYNNYSEKIKFCTVSRDASGAPVAERDYYCEFRGYRVARGEMQVKLHTYRLKEAVKKYDYYVLDVDVVNADRYGKSEKGWAKVHIDNVGKVKPVDYSDTQSISASEADCATVGLSIGHSVGPVSASVDWGSVTFCDDEASYVVDRRDGDNNTVYLATHTREISTLSSQRIVKVKRGKRPVFEVRVHVPNDDCTDTKFDNCSDYDNSTYLKSWRIRTTG